MAGPLVPNLPSRVLQLTVAAGRSHGCLHTRTPSHCVAGGKITFSLAKEILFLQTETAFTECDERTGGGVRGHREELGVTGMDATATLFSIQNSNGPHLS